MLSNVLEKFVPFLYNEDLDLDNPQGDIMIEFWTDTAGQDVVIELDGICEGTIYIKSFMIGGIAMMRKKNLNFGIQCMAKGVFQILHTHYFRI